MKPFVGSYSQWKSRVSYIRNITVPWRRMVQRHQQSWYWYSHNSICSSLQVYLITMMDTSLLQWKINTSVLYISFVMVEIIYMLFLFIIIKSEVWIITQFRVRSWNNGMRCWSFYILMDVSLAIWHSTYIHAHVCIQTHTHTCCWSVKVTHISRSFYPRDPNCFSNDHSRTCLSIH